MNRKRRLLIPIFLAALVAAITPVTVLAATDPFSGGSNTAGNFAVLANTTITNTGPSWITGQMGVNSASVVAITGFPPGTSGAQLKGGGVVTTALTDLTAAYTAAVQPCTADYSGQNLGGKTLGPGVYCQTTGATPSPTLTGTLTLSGSGVYIFLIGTTAAPTTLITAAGAPSAPAASVVLTGGASPCQVFWRVTSSATIATYTTFVGNIMALDSIAMQTGATLNGRALAQTGAVTLDTNRIIQAAGCGYAAPTYVAPPTGNILPATLAPSSPLSGVPPTPGLPATGVPSDLPGAFPLLLLIGIGTGGAALALAISSRRRRRNT
ncbi:MAG TPA: ice-binding family protein [Streptosporangiaceae bacterium]|nr:ice-binding family protein [Streptosporangiaceae bacterium]